MSFPLRSLYHGLVRLECLFWEWELHVFPEVLLCLLVVLVFGTGKLLLWLFLGGRGRGGLEGRTVGTVGVGGEMFYVSPEDTFGR